jgi:broad specificity phosphatase PhoE
VTTTIHLVRHAAHDLVDRVLVGRDDGVGLSGAGFRQAQALATRFAGGRIATVQSSPQLRAQQTAQPIAEMRGVPLRTAQELDELDMGAWTDRSFAELKHDPRWQLWNAQRANTRPPQGESMRELQRRVLGYLHYLATTYDGEDVVIVTHAEPIRAAVLHYLQRSLDDFATVQIAPASVTTILVRGRSGDIITNNGFRDFIAA